MSRHLVYGVHLTDRMKEAGDVQRLFSQYGTNIKTRIGLHDVGEGYCSPSGLILLEMYGDPGRCAELRARLAAIAGVEVKELLFEA